MSAHEKDNTNAVTQEIGNVVRLYDFSADATITYLSQSENTVYLITDPALPDQYVVRVSSGRLSNHTQASVTSELIWMKALGEETDVMVPTVMPAKDGSLVQTLVQEDPDKPKFAAVYTFLPGVEHREDEVIPGFERLGQISARMHIHTKHWTAPAIFQRHHLTPNTILDDELKWGAWQNGVGVSGHTLELLSRADSLVRRRLDRLETSRDNFGLIHADLRLANLLVMNDETAVIDFDDCGYGWFLFDLASALSFLEERPDVPDLIASWLEGYRRIADISEEMEAEIPSIIMLRRLQLLGWVGYQQDHLEFARQIGSDFTVDTCRLAEEYLIQHR